MSANKKLVTWTPELVERCRILWEVEGLSASQIAELVGGGCTRNAIIGKAHRCHWEPHRPPTGWPRQKRVITHPRGVERKRAAKAPRSLTRAQKPKKATPVPPAPVARPTPLPAIVPGTVRLLELRPGQCKWPVNDPPRGEGHLHLFCGKPQFGEKPYCELHARAAYTGTGRQKATAGWQPRSAEF